MQELDHDWQCTNSSDMIIMHIVSMMLDVISEA